MQVGPEMDTNEALIRRIRSSEANEDAYTDVMENLFVQDGI